MFLCIGAVISRSDSKTGNKHKVTQKINTVEYCIKKFKQKVTQKINTVESREKVQQFIKLKCGQR